MKINRIKMMKLFFSPFSSLFGSGIGNVKLFKLIFNLVVSWAIPKQYIALEANGCKLGMTIGGVVGLDALAGGIMFGSGYEIQTTKLFKVLVKEGMTVVDVGAHVGYYTVLASKLVGDKGKVIAFEPEPKNFENLANNVVINEVTNVTALRKAVGQEEKRAKLFVSDKASGECSLVYVANRPNKTIDVDVVALDNCLGEKIDVIKIDVDGGEIGVLMGAKQLMSNNPNIKVFTEIWAEGLKGAGYSCEDYLKVLADCGFNYIYLIDEKEKIIQRTNSEGVVKYLSKDAGINLLCCKNEDGVSFRGRIPKIVTEKMHKRIPKRLDVLCEILKEDDRVLEVGCGTGAYVVDALKYLPIHIVAIDKDRASLEYAMVKNRADNVEYVLSAGEDYEDTEKFDVIVCSHILEHLEKPKAMLDNIRRLLETDGVLYVGVPNGYGCFEIENYLPRLVSRTSWGVKLINRMRGESVKDTLNTESQHIKFFTIKGIVHLLMENGFGLEAVINEGLLGGVITDRTILKIPKIADWNINIADRLPASMANGWILICRKSL